MFSATYSLTSTWIDLRSFPWYGTGLAQPVGRLFIPASPPYCLQFSVYRSPPLHGSCYLCLLPCVRTADALPDDVALLHLLALFVHTCCLPVAYWHARSRTHGAPRAHTCATRTTFIHTVYTGAVCWLRDAYTALFPFAHFVTTT